MFAFPSLERHPVALVQHQHRGGREHQREREGAKHNPRGRRAGLDRAAALAAPALRACTGAADRVAT